MCVHHKGAMSDDGLIQGRTCEQQCRGVLLDIHHKQTAALFHYCKLCLPNCLLAAHLNGPFQYEHGEGVTLCQFKSHTASGIKLQIPYIHRRERARWACVIRKMTGDHPGLTRIVG